MSKLSVDDALLRLEKVINDFSPMGIAVSGGVDSMTLAYIANKLQSTTQMFHALSPAVPVSASQRVKDYADQYAWPLQLINAKEMEDLDYVNNPVNRCFFCKSNLYKTISQNTSGNIASGTNLDDLNDFRPGLKAADNYQVIHPFVMAKIDKSMIRKLAHFFGLFDLEELPASPCLSSRVTTGLAIDAELLPLIDQAENKVRELLSSKVILNSVRCRVRKENISIQLEMEPSLDDNFPYRDSICETVRGLFHNSKFVEYAEAIILEPYTKGSAFIHP